MCAQGEPFDQPLLPARAESPDPEIYSASADEDLVRSAPEDEDEQQEGEREGSSQDEQQGGEREGSSQDEQHEGEREGSSQDEQQEGAGQDWLGGDEEGDDEAGAAAEAPDEIAAEEEAPMVHTKNQLSYPYLKIL